MKRVARRQTVRIQDMNKETKLAKKCQSDYVRLVIELAYLPEEEARALTLTTRSLMDRVT
jgi:hypothetical protein